MTLGKITAINKNKITIELEEDINLNYLKLLADDEDNYAKIKFIDNRGMTAKQNALSHCLIADITKAAYGDKATSKEKNIIKKALQAEYKEQTGIEFLHRNATRSEAKEWIEFLIEFVLEEDITLPKRYEYLTEYTAFFYYCLKYRKCCICGKKADVCHDDVVGMGNNRKKIDHSEKRFFSCCRKHHREEHNIGTDVFLKKYKITTIKLSDEDRKKLNVGG